MSGGLVRAGVRQGDVVLVPGASGGVGSALIQLANRRGARTVAMCAEDKAAAVAAILGDARHRADQQVGQGLAVDLLGHQAFGRQATLLRAETHRSAEVGLFVTLLARDPAKLETVLQPIKA